MLYVAEEIYNSIVDIKKKDKDISNIDAIERYIGTDSYTQISSGNKVGLNFNLKKIQFFDDDGIKI